MAGANAFVGEGVAALVGEGVGTGAGVTGAGSDAFRALKKSNNIWNFFWPYIHSFRVRGAAPGARVGVAVPAVLVAAGAAPVTGVDSSSAMKSLTSSGFREAWAFCKMTTAASAASAAALPGFGRKSFRAFTSSSCLGAFMTISSKPPLGSALKSQPFFLIASMIAGLAATDAGRRE